MFDDVGLSIRARGGKQGQFDYANSIVTLFRNHIEGNMRVGASDYTRTTIHELWHSLSRYLPTEDITRVDKTFQKELSKYTSKNPWFKTVVENPKGITGFQYKEISKQFPEVATRWYPAEGDRYVFRWGKENYLYKSIDEWFSESLTDKTLERFARMDENTRSIFLHAKNVLHTFIETIQRLFGGDVAGKILNDFFDRKNTEIVREVPLWYDKLMSSD